MSTIILYMLNIPDPTTSYTLLTVSEYLKLFSLKLLPIEAQLIASAIGHYFFIQSKDIRDNYFKMQVNHMVHVHSLIDFKDMYEPYCNVPVLIEIARSLKERLSEEFEPSTLASDYCRLDHGEKLGVSRAAMRILARSCRKSSLPLRLYLLIRLRHMDRLGYCRLRQDIAATILQCSIRQLQRSANQLISLNLITKTRLKPQLTKRHGVMLHITNTNNKTSVLKRAS